MTAARRQTTTRPASAADARAYLDKALEFLRAAEDSLELGNCVAAAGTPCTRASLLPGPHRTAPILPSLVTLEPAERVVEQVTCRRTHRH